MSTHSAQSSVSSDTPKLSLVATFDDLNRLNDILNDGYGEECFLRFLSNMNWCRQQWAASETEAKRLQRELDEALTALSGWENKFSNARKLLDAEKKQRKIAIEKCESLEKQMALARDLLFNDNRNKLNNETLEKLAFLNGSRFSVNDGKLNAIPEFNSTGTFLLDASVSRSEDDLDLSVRHSYIRPRHSGIRSPLRSHNTSENPPAKKRRSSNSTSNTQVVEINGGRVLAKATTTLTVEQTPSKDKAQAANNMNHIKEEDMTTDTDTEPTPVCRTASKTVTSTLRTHLTPFSPSAPPKTDSESASDATPRVAAAGLETRGSIRGDTWGSPRTQMRSHTFISKALYRSEQCQVCEKKIRFAKTCLRCEVCRGTCHSDCSYLLPLPCIPQKATPYSNMNNQMSIADYAPSSPPMVPALLVHCINEVEKRGLSEMGLYRVSGSDKEIKKLKEKFLRGRGAPPLGDEDVHVLCGCIKDFIRCLREPLITHSLWPDFMSVAQAAERLDTTAALVQAISQLPPPNRDTLAFLILHLQRVAESPECKMPVSNLSKVFGPTIVGYADTEAAEMYTQTQKLLTVMELLLTLPSEYWAQFAGGHALCPPSSPAPRPAPPSHPAQYTPQTPSTRTRGFFYKTTVTGPTSRRKFFD